MNEEKNKSVVNYRFEMKKRIDLAAYAGVFILFVNFVADIILKKCFSVISYTEYMIFVLLNTCVSMLPFLIVYHIKCDKIKKLIIVPKKEQCGFAGWLGYVILGFGLCTAINFITSLISTYMFNTETGTVVSQYVTDIPSLCLGVFAVGIIPAVCEELLFRGCIMGSLKKYNVLMSVVISAIIFSMIHSSISSMIFAFFSGMILGFVRIYTGYFSAAVAVHFMNNALALTSGVAGNLIGENVENVMFYLSGIVGIILTVVCVILIGVKKIKTDCIFSENNLPSAQSVENTVSSSGMLLVFVLCAIAHMQGLLITLANGIMLVIVLCAIAGDMRGTDDDN